MTLRKDTIESILSAFYIDDAGRLDIAFNRCIPFATMYERLHSHSSANGNILHFRADPCRMYMYVAVLSGILHDSISQEVNDQGRLVITAIHLPKSVGECLDCEKQLFNAYLTIPALDERRLHYHFPFYDHATTSDQVSRKTLDSLYGTRMNEMQAIYEIFSSLLFKVGQINHDSPI